MHAPDIEAREMMVQKRVFYSRVGIISVAAVFGIVSAFSVVGFFFNLAVPDRMTGLPIMTVGPMWMFGHVIRGAGLGVLTFRMLRYQSAMKHWRPSNGEGLEAFLAAQSAAWMTGAVVLGLIAIYAIAYTAGGAALH